MKIEEEIGRRIAAVEVFEGDFADVAARGRRRRAARRSAWGAVVSVAVLAIAMTSARVASDDAMDGPAVATSIDPDAGPIPLTVTEAPGRQPPSAGSGSELHSAVGVDHVTGSILYAGTNRCGQDVAAWLRGSTVTLSFTPARSMPKACPLVLIPITYVIGAGQVAGATTLVVERPAPGGGTESQSYELETQAASP